MKIRKLVALVLLGLLCGCVALAEISMRPSAIKLDRASLVLGLDNANRQAEIRVKKFIYPDRIDHGTPSYLQWQSLDPDLVVVTADPVDPSRCLVSAGPSQRMGSAYVQITCGNAIAKCKVSVQQTVKASLLKLGKTKASLYLGLTGPKGTLSVQPKILPDTASANDPARALVHYKSSNARVASVDERGVITPRQMGSATISVWLSDGSKRKAKLKLTVKQVPVDAVRLLPLSLGVGEKLPLTALLSPDDAPERRLSFTSSNPKVASVGKDGMVQGIKRGTAVIRCVSKSGGRRASCTVTVGDFGQPRYLFYGVGNSDYVSGETSSGALDAQAVGRLYQGMKSCAVHTNLDAAGIERVLVSMAQNPAANEAAVSVFYFGGCGAQMADAGMQGALVGVDGAVLPLPRVKALLDKVPGRVVVMMDSSMAGRFASDKAAFDRAVLKTFSGKAFAGSSTPGKYSVLTACGPEQATSAIWLDGTMRSLFSLSLESALGGDCPADANLDGRVSLGELQRATDARMEALIGQLLQQGYVVHQRVTAWPDRCEDVVFARG